MSIAYSLARGGITRIYDACLNTPPILTEDDYFPQASLFVDAWESLRDEARNIAGNLSQVPQFHEIMAEQYKLSKHGEKEWRMFILRAYGLDIKENMQHCPALSALISTNPNIKSASLSFLAPGKHVPTHTGPFRGITRFYLGLDVPLDTEGNPGVTLTIDDRPYKLGSGDALLWDDTYPHSVQNNTDQWRIALLLDVYRAKMSWPLRKVTDSVIGMAKLSIKYRKIFPEEFA